MKCMPLAVVLALSCAVGCATMARAPRDPFGQWHVAKIYSGTEGRMPARDFVVQFVRADPSVVDTYLSGRNSHSSSMRVDGEMLRGMGVSTQTLLGGCIRREDIESIGHGSTQAATTSNPCASDADEELIANIVAAPTSWHEHGGLLLVRSNPRDSWIELRR